ncbi:MAG: hypothetical protein DHS20C10_04510 [marine bacterium B5-7]|nr:MAG: hypothetical protein DHS20C10_04510 [marine bacterium B5-7]
MNRPTLTATLSKETFQQFYWEKKELVAFCRENAIPSNGSKQTLAERIAHFLQTSEVLKPEKIKRVGPWDSEAPITPSTLLVNYRNDTKTRAFFVSQLGEAFRFNAYLRAFAKAPPQEKITYGDLVIGWKKAETEKKEPGYQTKIGKQFEFNQFTRDYSSYKNKDKLPHNSREAWQIIRSKPGPNTFEHYLFLSQKT